MQPVRGTHDFLPDTLRAFHHIVTCARDHAHFFGFQEMATPLLEQREVFQRSAGVSSDIVSKEMYEVIDRGGGPPLILRPEGTAPVMRAILSNGLTQTLPLKFFYQGPMFRYDRPQKGRTRQFHQVGVEYVGVPEPWSDVEVIACGLSFLSALGLGPLLSLQLNTLGDLDSRQRYREALVCYFENFKTQLSAESQQRLALNPLRILDSKSPQDQDIVAQAPSILEFLTPAAAAFFDQVQEGLTLLDIPYTLSPRLVRGLDYYSHTAFEIVSTQLGVQQGTVLAGGRYDHLMTLLGGPQIPGVGWAAGIERLMMLLDTIPASLPVIGIIATDEPAVLESLALAQFLRQQAIAIDVMGQGNLGKKLKKADKMGYSLVLILGETERVAQKITVKNLKTGQQEMVEKEKLHSTIKDMVGPAGLEPATTPL